MSTKSMALSRDVRDILRDERRLREALSFFTRTHEMARALAGCNGDIAAAVVKEVRFAVRQAAAYNLEHGLEGGRNGY